MKLMPTKNEWKMIVAVVVSIAAFVVVVSYFASAFNEFIARVLPR